MNTIEVIRSLMISQVRHVRNCNYLVQSDDFQIAFGLANEDERIEALVAIAELNKSKLREFIITTIQKGTPFDRLSLRKLHEIGSNLSIPYYKDLTKYELIKEIQNVATRLKENSK